ncbi:MAG: c-type cytochrome [Burkholderiales bacterium]|nr:c-type cytochrome [Burkholderiales bacterium]
MPHFSTFSKWMTHLFAILATCLLLSLTAMEVQAATTTGNASNGASVWGKCVACHGGTPAGARFNAANASNVIDNAITNNFGNMMAGQSSLTDTERKDVAAYIGSLMSNTTSVSVPYNTATQFTIPNLVTGTGTFSSILTVTAPTKGAVTFSGTTATYTPTAGQSGSDTFTYNGIGSAGTSNLRTVNITIANPTPGSFTPQTGWWWNPSEGGRGYTIEQQGSKIFMAGYMYDASGRASWYAAGPAEISASVFTAPLTTYLGGQTLTGAFKATTGTANNGNISITFTNPTTGIITWPNGTTTAIQRYDIVTNGSTATIPNGTPQAGWWWNNSEGGRGFSIEIQNNTMFLAGYMYDNSGNPIWYASGPTAMTNSTTYQGTWQEYGNGQVLQGSFKAASVVNSNVGNITVTFTNATTGTLTLPDGRQIPLIRYTFQ